MGGHRTGPNKAEQWRRKAVGGRSVVCSARPNNHGGARFWPWEQLLVDQWRDLCAIRRRDSAKSVTSAQQRTWRLCRSFTLQRLCKSMTALRDDGILPARDSLVPSSLAQLRDWLQPLLKASAVGAFPNEDQAPALGMMMCLLGPRVASRAILHGSTSISSVPWDVYVYFKPLPPPRAR